jgi:hypothetical protein
MGDDDNVDESLRCKDGPDLPLEVFLYGVVEGVGNARDANGV